MSNVFDEIFALLKPERLLRDPQANGEGVSICLIDSGVEQSLLAEKHPNMKPIEGGIFTSNTDAPKPYDGHQSTPHGTTVADIILTIAPGVKLYTADVFGPKGSCEVETVMHALRWAIDEWHCKIVNMSLGVSEQRLRQLPRRFQFLKAVEESYYKDVLIFAAAHNEHPFTRSYPAMFAPPLISVDKSLFDDPLQFAYHLRDHIEFQAYAKGYLGPFAHEPATSWAAPHLAAIAARMLSLRPGLKPFEIKTILYWLFQTGSNGSA